MAETPNKLINPVWQVKERHQPLMPDGFAIISVAISIVAMIFLGQLYILIFYALWLPRIYYKKNWTIKPTKAIIFPAIIIIYSLASTIWSVHTGMTLRAGLQFASVICCSLIISRIVRINAFIKGVTLGMCIALIIVLISTGSIHTETALVGSLGSKNQVGANAQIGLYCAIICGFIFKKYWAKILMALPAMFLCAGCLILSKSATSNVSFFAMIIVSGIAYIIAKLSRQFRILAFITAIFLAAIITSIGMSINVEEAGLKATGKDITLTGRTFLWEEGIKIGMKNPILGSGLGAFWIPGTPEAEKIWFKFNIFHKSGFHFHNLFINIFVELGIIGVILWGLMYMFLGIKSFRYLLKNGGGIESIFYIGIASMYFVRSISESDTGGPYGVGPLLFFYIVFRVASKNISRYSTPLTEQKI